MNKDIREYIDESLNIALIRSCFSAADIYIEFNQFILGDYETACEQIEAEYLGYANYRESR